MGLSDSKTKNYFIFCQKSPHTFQPKLEKIKKIHPEKKKIIFQEMKLFSSNIKKKKKNSGNVNAEKNSLYFRKQKPYKSLLYFRKWDFLTLRLKYFLHFLKINLVLYFQKWNPALFSPSPENKNIHLEKTETPKNFVHFFQKKAALIFQEMEILKKLLIFQETKLSYISGRNF